jgi:hypothetical protein
MNQQDPNQIAFLQGTWRALLQDQPEPFAKTLLQEFLSSDVMGGLPALTTLKNVLQECHAREAFQASYIKSFLGLRRVWDRLTPESRHIIIQYGNKCGMQGSLRLNPLPDDEAALGIRWDTANRLYDASRDQAFRSCQGLGLEMAQPRGLPCAGEFSFMVQRGQETLLALLRERVDIDKTAVTMAVGFVTPVSRTKLLYNFDSAHTECREALRAALVHWTQHHPAALMPAEQVSSPLSPAQEDTLRAYVDGCLQPFDQRCKQLRQLAEDMSSEPTLYEKVRKHFQDPVLH